MSCIFSTFQITSFTNKNTQQLKCARINGSEDDMWVIDTEYKLKGEWDKNFFFLSLRV